MHTKLAQFSIAALGTIFLMGYVSGASELGRISHQSNAQSSSRTRIRISAPSLVSHAASAPGLPTSGICFTPLLSPTGQFVLFSCQATDVIGGEPGIGDLIQNDAVTNVNTGAGLDTDGQWGYCQGAELGTCGAAGIAVDAIGRQVVFNSGAPLTPDAVQLIPNAGTPYVFLRNEAAATTTLLTPPPQNESSPAYMEGKDASLERSEVLFSSVFNLSGDADGNGLASDLYVRNWISDSVELISVAPDGAQGDADTGFGVFSPDGRYVAFLSFAANLTNDNPQHFPNLFLRDRYLSTTRRLTFPGSGGDFPIPPFFSGQLRITADNHYLLFGASGVSFTTGDDPSLLNLYLLDLISGAVEQLPRTVDRLRPDASVSGDISDDATRLVFVSAATNVTADSVPGVFVQDLSSNEVVGATASLGPLARPPGTSLPRARISSDGSALAFEWPTFNAMFPTLLENQQIYRVAIRSATTSDAEAIPAMSRLAGIACALLILGLASNALRGSRRERP